MSSSNNNTNNNSKPIFSIKMADKNSSSELPSSSSNEHDRLLPIANVGRIMKQILPSNAKISKEAKETMQECVSEFIGFVTGEASEKCRKERRKTVNGDDVCWAMGTLGFDDYAGPLKRYLDRYRELEGDNRSANNNNNVQNNSDNNQNRVSDNNTEELMEENILLYTNYKPPHESG